VGSTRDRSLRVVWLCAHAVSTRVVANVKDGSRRDAHNVADGKSLRPEGAPHFRKKQSRDQ